MARRRDWPWFLMLPVLFLSWIGVQYALNAVGHYFGWPFLVKSYLTFVRACAEGAIWSILMFVFINFRKKKTT